jgi:DNA gyrase/topoisomerase IV subunit B
MLDNSISSKLSSKTIQKRKSVYIGPKETQTKLTFFIYVLDNSINSSSCKSCKGSLLY